MKKNILVGRLNNMKDVVKSIPNNPLSKLENIGQRFADATKAPMSKAPIPQTKIAPMSIDTRWASKGKPMSVDTRPMSTPNTTQSNKVLTSASKPSSRFLGFQPGFVNPLDKLKMQAEDIKAYQEKKKKTTPRVDQATKKVVTPTLHLTRDQQFANLIKIGNEQGGVGWMDSISDEVAKTQFPDLFADKQSFGRLKTNMERVYNGEATIDELIARYEENKPGYLSDLKSQDVTNTQGGRRSQIMKDSPTFGRIDPTKQNLNSDWGAYLWGFVKNAGASTANLASDLGNMIVNPVDSLNNLAKMGVGATANLVGADERMSQQGQWLNEANQIADGMGGYIMDRYGSLENFSKSSYEDPVGVFSDLASIVTGGAGAVKAGASAVAKGARVAGAVNTANKASKVANIAGKVMKVADAVDPASIMMRGAGNVAVKGGQTIIKALPSAEKTLQNMNRITKGEQSQFAKMTGKSQGQWMNERGMVAGGEKAVDMLADYFLNSKKKVDEAMATVQGSYKNDMLTLMAKESADFAENTLSEGANRMRELETKAKEAGLTMSEINEVKRFYEQNNKFTYGKDITAGEKTLRATNIDNAVREWQIKVAEENGFDNLRELNKETQASKFLLDKLVKNENGRIGNNYFTLTDYITGVGVAVNPSMITALVGKKLINSNWFRSKYTKLINKINGHQTIAEKIADLEKIKTIQSKKDLENFLALEYKGYNGVIGDQTKIIADQNGNAWREGQVVELDNTKIGPQVKTPLSPQPTRRSIIEIDKRPNILGDTIARNSKKIEKKSENIVGLKTMKKTGNSEKSQYTTTDASNTSSVSLTEKKNKVAGAKVGSSGATARGGNSGRPTTDFSNLEKTKVKGWHFDLSHVKEEYQKNYDRIISGEGDNLEVGMIDGKVTYDGKERPAIFSQAIQRKIVGDHGLDKANLLATVNEPDYIIKNIDGKADKINIIKKIEGTNDFVLIGADRQNGYFILSNYEVKSRNNKRLIKSLGRGDVVIDNVGDSSNLKPKNIIGLKHSPRETVDTSNTETKHPKEKIFETLPEDVSVFDESKKLGPKRIAPDRRDHQQLDPQSAMEKLAKTERKLRENKIKNLEQDLEKYRSIMKKYDGKLPARTEKNRTKYPDLVREYGEIQHLKKLYSLAGEITKSQNIEQTIEGMIAFNKSKMESITPERMKERYIELVQQDLSKGYKYPEAVLNFVPEARKILNGRERYEKGLHTSFSAKDERINYDYKEEIGSGMKRQDGKQLTQEQKEDIVEGVKDFGNVLGIDMKKLGEEKKWVYVHLNGKNVFLKNGVGGLYREKGENISISVGGIETVRQTLGGEVSAVKVHTVMSHELGHALDAIQNWKLFPSGKLFDLKIRMNKAPTSNARYWKSDAEITARAIEQYIAIKKGNTAYYDKPAYWKQEVYEHIIEPMVKEAIEAKFGGYMKGKIQSGKPLPKSSQDRESAMIWFSEKTSKKITDLTKQYPAEGKNELEKVGKLNSQIPKSSGKRSEKDKAIYRVKDDILLDDIIEKGLTIKDEGEQTTYTLEQDGVYVTWHLGDRVRRILKQKGLLK